MRQLEVCNHGVPAGVLTEERGVGYTFVYYEDYLQSGAPAVSLAMPTSQREYRSRVLFPPFTQHLPEGATLRTICWRHRIDPADAFSLLEHFIGRDHIGSVSFRHLEG